MIILPLIRIIMAIVKKHQAAGQPQPLNAPATYNTRTSPFSH